MRLDLTVHSFSFSFSSVSFLISASCFSRAASRLVTLSSSVYTRCSSGVGMGVDMTTVELFNKQRNREKVILMYVVECLGLVVAPPSPPARVGAAAVCTVERQGRARAGYVVSRVLIVLEESHR